MIGGHAYRTRILLVVVLTVIGVQSQILAASPRNDSQLNRDLLKAVKQDDLTTAKRLLDQGADPDVRESWPSRHSSHILLPNALEWAASRGDPVLVRVLLKHGAKVNATGFNAEDEPGLGLAGTALIAAVNNNHPDVVQILLKRGADVNQIYTSVGPALVYAQTVRMARLLLDGGAHVNTRSADSLTPLESAASCHNVDLVRLLLKHGADVNAKDPTPDSALICAAFSGESDVGLTGGSHAARMYSHIVECVQLLIDAGADVTIHTREGYSALLGAAATANDECVRLLVEKGAVVTGRDGDWALNRAVVRGMVNTVRLLLDHGAQVNARDQGNGMTPLMHAASNGNKEMCRLLLDRSADVNLTDRDGWTAFMFAEGNEPQQAHQEVIELLKKAGAKTIPVPTRESGLDPGAHSRNSP